MPHENGLSWTEHLFKKHPIDTSSIVDLCLTKSPEHHQSRATKAPYVSSSPRAPASPTTLSNDSSQNMQHTHAAERPGSMLVSHSNNVTGGDGAGQVPADSAFNLLPPPPQSSPDAADTTTNTHASSSKPSLSIQTNPEALLNIPSASFLSSVNLKRQSFHDITSTASPYQTPLEPPPPRGDNNSATSDALQGKYYIFALCCTSEKQKKLNAQPDSTFQSIPRYFPKGSLTLNILSFESGKHQLNSELLNFQLPDQVEKRISKCVVDPKHECIFLFLRSATQVHIYKWIPKTGASSELIVVDRSSSVPSPTIPNSGACAAPQKSAQSASSQSSAFLFTTYDTPTGCLQKINVEAIPNNFVLNASKKRVPKILLDEDDSWITWVGKSMANGLIYGLVKCITPFALKFKLDVLWISFDTSTFELEFLNVESHVRVSEVFSYENDDVEPPTLVLSNGEIFVLNLKHEEYDRKIPRLNLSLMQWTNIPYRISHKYRRKHIESKEELQSIQRNSTSVAYIGFRYFIVLTRTRVFELFNSDWKIFSDLKELVHWKPFSDRPQMLATYRFQSIYILNRNLELFEVDITYVQKLLSLHSLEHDMALALNHPKHTDMMIRLQHTKSPLPVNLRRHSLQSEQEYPHSKSPLLNNDDDDAEVVDIKVHSLVIKTRAPEVFKLAEKHGNRFRIVLSDFRRSAVQHALKYIYTNQLDTSISKLTAKELWDLYAVSQKFALEKLRERCSIVQNRKIYQSRKERGLPSEFLKRKFDEDLLRNQLPQLSNNVPSLAQLKFKNANAEYFNQNFERAISLYSDTLKDSTAFLVQVLIKRCGAYEKENQLELALADAEKALILCEDDKKMQAKIKMRIGYIMNLMNKPFDGYISFCEAHELDANSSGLFWDSSSLQHAGHKLKLEGYPLPEKYKYMHTEVVSELARSFQPLIDNPNDSDFRFYFRKQNRTVYAHQLFMSMESGFFRRMLQHKHNQVVVVNVDDISAEATVQDILMLLEWIYTRKSAFIYKLSNDRLCCILKLADFFDMYYIANEAQFQLIAKLKEAPITEVIYYISIAHSAGLRDVYNDLFDIVSDRLKEVEDLDLKQLTNRVSEEILNLIETSFQCVSKSADVLKRSLSTRDVQHMQIRRRTLSGDFDSEDDVFGSPLNQQFNVTRTMLSQCPVRLFGSSFEDPLDGLCIVEGRCSSWGSIWALHNLGTNEHLYKNPQENFTIKFELMIDSFHPQYVQQGIYFVCELHRNVHSRNTQHPVFRLLVEDEMIRLQLTSNRWDFPYKAKPREECDQQSRVLIESVAVTFNKDERVVSCSIANRENIQVQWPPSSYENMTTERRLFMSLSAKNERQYARYRIVEWLADSSSGTKKETSKE
uniref:BTB domain-containing protein n=1 Tax=Percolomonas cosmopolitus TaxID=63605 RepID=A0A7S1KSF3_9EUKA|mmetsp:Transcript_7566/g.28427  ORF Transcript_7566/g.28427 Transcript_7566/m.28427 type:complete len:1368 (+) Transcript_7566:233-4336(+)